MDNIKTWPDRIWLQHGVEDAVPDFKECDGITWEREDIHGNDVAYVRADLATGPQPIFKPGIVRYMPASVVMPSERDYAHRSTLYRMGDMILVWANEGDIILHNRFPVPKPTS